MESNYDFDSIQEQSAINQLDSNVVTKTFFWMFLGLVGTALVAWYTYSSGLWVKVFTSNAIIALPIIELVVVLLFSALFRKLSPTIVACLYFLYSMVNGVTFSSIFVVYNLSSIIYAFVATAALFGVLALFGYKTKLDLTKLGTICTAGLIVGLIFSIVNLFIGNTMLDIALTWIILIIFCGITAYDLNKLKKAQEYGTYESDKLHIYFAMELYLDFINIFIRLLSIISKNSRN